MASYRFKKLHVAVVYGIFLVHIDILLFGIVLQVNQLILFLNQYNKIILTKKAMQNNLCVAHDFDHI